MIIVNQNLDIKMNYLFKILIFKKYYWIVIVKAYMESDHIH